LINLKKLLLLLQGNKVQFNFWRNIYEKQQKVTCSNRYLVDGNGGIITGRSASGASRKPNKHIVIWLSFC